MNGRPRVVFDPNVRTTGNLTYVGLEDIPAGLLPGQEVELYEEESGTSWPGALIKVDTERLLAYFTVVWGQDVIDALARRRGEGHRCVAPRCGAVAVAAYVVDEDGPLAGREWLRGDFIDLCPPHSHDVLAARHQPINQLPDWLRADAEVLKRRRDARADAARAALAGDGGARMLA